jgi:predicted GNAT family acetyltransferase
MAEVFVHNPVAGRFEAWVDGEFVGELAYVLTDSVAVFESTHVSTGTVVRGLGGRLVQYAFGVVREQGEWRVQPECPYVLSWIEKNPGVRDLLA